MAVPTANLAIDDRHQINCAGNCFPARTKFRTKSDGGAWLVAHNTEEKNRIKALLHSKPLTFEEVRELRRKAEKNGTTIALQTANNAAVVTEDDLLLDGFFLLKYCAAHDPSDLCVVNISGQGLTEAKPDDFLLFDNVTSINASENILPFEPFCYFPSLQKLEIAVNGLQGIRLTVNQFRHLEDLDISYNNLSAADVLMLGILSCLHVLNISGNNLSTLSEDMSYPASLSGDKTQLCERIERFSSLERLIADDNHLTEASFFTALAGLKRLKFLSVAKNEISAIPQLLLVQGRYITVEESTSKVQPNSKKKRSNLKFDKLQSLADMKLESGANKTPCDMDESVTSLSLPPPAHHQVFSPLPPPCPLPPPFSSLICLDVAFNKITEERSLLPVASWPKIQKLIIHDNPLTTQYSGELPVLKKFLQDRLNIQIQRKKTPEVEKPSCIVVPDTSKKIKTRVPSMPHCNIEDLLLAIEGPKVSRSLSLVSATCEQGPSDAVGSSKTPLPPIERCSSHTSKTDASEEINSVLKGSECAEEDSKESSITAKSSAGPESNSDPIFMTEMMNDILTQEILKGEREGRMPVESPSFEKYSWRVMEQNDDNANNEDDLENLELQKKYKTYDDLLTVEETTVDDLLPSAHDINGNVRALRHILNHPLIFQGKAVCLDRKQKPFQLWAKKPDLRCKPSKTRNEKTASVLENLKLRSTFVEAPLTEVLSGKSYEKEFRDAKKLLNEVQHCYNGVRVTSMKQPEKAFARTYERNVKPLFACPHQHDSWSS